METETIDKLYLELAQVTRAVTPREKYLTALTRRYQRFASYCRSCALSGEANPDEFVDFLSRYPDPEVDYTPNQLLDMLLDEEEKILEKRMKGPNAGDYYCQKLEARIKDLKFMKATRVEV